VKTAGFKGALHLFSAKVLTNGERSLPWTGAPGAAGALRSSRGGEFNPPRAVQPFQPRAPKTPVLLRRLKLAF